MGCDGADGCRGSPLRPRSRYRWSGENDVFTTFRPAASFGSHKNPILVLRNQPRYAQLILNSTGGFYWQNERRWYPFFSSASRLAHRETVPRRSPASGGGAISTTGAGTVGTDAVAHERDLGTASVQRGEESHGAATEIERRRDPWRRTGDSRLADAMLDNAAPTDPPGKCRAPGSVVLLAVMTWSARFIRDCRVIRTGFCCRLHPPGFHGFDEQQRQP